MITKKMRLNRTYVDLADGRPNLPAGEYVAYIGEPKVYNESGQPNGHVKVVYCEKEYSLDNADFSELTTI